MKSFLFDKLVRDKILKKFEDDGVIVHSKIIKNDNDFLEAISQKIVEELDEVFQSETKEELIKELADFEDVFDVFKKLIKVSDEEIDSAKKEKNKEYGGFKKRIAIEYIEIPQSNKWYTYCKDRPEKYPEVIKQEEDFNLSEIIFDKNND